MKDDTEDIKRREAQLNGRTEGPYGSDDTDVDRPAEDNRNRYDQENSANGLDSEQVRGGQDGRNNRGIGSTDMDGKNGVLRMGDQDNSTMEVTNEALNSIGPADKTNTASVSTSSEPSGRNDLAENPSDSQTRVPDAQSEQESTEESGDSQSSQEKNDNEIAQTGTDLTNEPTY